MAVTLLRMRISKFSLEKMEWEFFGGPYELSGAKPTVSKHYRSAISRLSLQTLVDVRLYYNNTHFKEPYLSHCTLDRVR